METHIIEKVFLDIYDENLAYNAIINDRHPGFREDYLVIHCLLKQLNPKSVMELGSHTGFGTLVIKNAVPDATVYTLDLPDELYYKSAQHPISEGKRGGVGHECYLPFIQLWGDSTKFDYSLYPCEAVFIDAEHSEENVFLETSAILKLQPKLIIFHDCDSENVWNGIINAKEKIEEGKLYELYRVSDTRIGYLKNKFK